MATDEFNFTPGLSIQTSWSFLMPRAAVQYMAHLQRSHIEESAPSQPRQGGLAAKAMTSQWNHTCLSPSLETRL